MKRYFFDVAARAFVQYDYVGREFEQPDKANELAELIALDLGCSGDETWAGAEVRVHNAHGNRLFAVAIR
jgi:hypothetical protein